MIDAWCEETQFSYGDPPYPPEIARTFYKVYTLPSWSLTLFYHAYTSELIDGAHSLVLVLEGFGSAVEAQAWLSEVMAEYGADRIGHTQPEGVVH